MAVSNVGQFTQAPRLSQVQFSTANTNRDGSTGTYSAALSVGSNGAILNYLRFQAQVTTAAGMLRIFYSPDSGTTWRLWAEIPTNAVTVSGTVGGDVHVWYPDGKTVIPSTGQFKFNTNNAETWNAFLAAEDL